ncbi:uncharacterized protein BKA55DRAFT_520860 [Fusarium redolens]|uniref:Uncharacterized protein n=1 Tax=Fusarium redolens TaxID=48865 RepID=A0A9P9JTU8_FUSRE|nr:uncharacterized protein BKA55DRAFT_520860 [Fusarium redolens]KAH7236758.1 hypothetical protein BKA55DRAFT_520860 [Fusarium redolens]
MDCFSKLPPELRIQILSQFSSTTTIFRLIRASPIMFAQYRASKATIRRHYVVNLLTGDRHEELLQDALGLLYLDLADNRPDNHVMKYIIRQWTSKALPNPLEEKDQATIAKLYKLFSHMSMFVEEYISKATALNPPQAYLCLPQISIPIRGLYYNEHSFSPKYVTLDELTSSECQFLVWAFMRFDMLCKTHGPGAALLIDKNEHSAITEKILYQLADYEHEAIYCVLEYLPKECIPALLGFVYDLPDLGFDLLRNLVLFANKTQPEDVRSWFYTIFSEWTRSTLPPPRNHRFPLLGGLSMNLDRHLDDSLRSFLVRRLSPTHYLESARFSLIPFRLRALCLQRRIFRQRAWVFLDDTRLSQKDPDHFPLIEDLYKQQTTANKLDYMFEVQERERLRLLQLCQYRREVGFKDTQNEGQEYTFRENDQASIPRLFDRSGNRDVTTFWRHI